MFRSTFRGALVLLASILPVLAAFAGDTADPRAAVEAASEAYVRAWLSNDPAAVMATLTDDVVLLPSGVEPLVGHEAVRAFWWSADADPSKVIDYRSSYDEIEVSGDLAFVRGVNELTFRTEPAGGEPEVSESRSAYLMILRRGEDGAWRIARRMWGRL